MRFKMEPSALASRESGRDPQSQTGACLGIEAGGNAVSIIMNRYARTAFCVALDLDRYAAASAIREAVLHRIGHRLRDDQGGGDCRVGHQTQSVVTAGRNGHIMTAAGLNHAQAQLGQERDKRLGSTRRVVQLPADAADESETSRRFVERRPFASIGQLALLHRKETCRDLKIVGYPMLQFAKQRA